MQNFYRMSFAFVLALSVFTDVNAKIIKEEDQTAHVVVNPDYPQRGSTKQQVESRYGAPASQQGPVGQPPIYRWDYDSYSVFFEDNYVLHSVAH